MRTAHVLGKGLVLSRPYVRAPPRIRGALSALFLLAAVGIDGLGVLELPLAVALALVALVSKPADVQWEPSRRARIATVVLLTTLFLVRVALLPVRDQPLGTDWSAYLRNAVVLADGDWENWHRWRGPLHAALCVALTPVAGGLLEASQLLSAAALAACIPLTAWLVRSLAGGLSGLVAASLLALWPDFVLFGRMSTPYPLLTFLLLAGACASIVAVKRPIWALPAGAAFAGCGLTDARGPVLAFCVLAGLLWMRPPWRVVATLGFVAAAGSGLVLYLLPIDLVPLATQVGLQRDLNATGLPAVCAAHQGAPPRVGDFFDACARATLRENLVRAQRVAPVGLPVLAALGLLGVSRSTLFLVVPICSLAASLVLVAVPHRYGVPLAPFGVGLASVAIVRVTQNVPRIAWLAAAAVVLAVMVPWNQFSGSLLARAYGAPVVGEAAPSVLVTEDRGLTRVRAILRTERDDARVVDCARAGLRMRLYPRPVEEIGTGRVEHQAARCRSLYGRGTDEPTWLLIVLTPGEVPDSRWREVYRWARGPAELVLVRNGG